MKLIKPSFEILEPQGCLKDIELAGRVCYQSQDKISEGDNSSAILFVNNLLKRKHYSVLEFGADLIVRIADEETKNCLLEWLIIHNQFTGIDFKYDDDYNLIMRINPRKALELFYAEDHADLVPSIYEFCRFIQNHLPFLILEKVDFNTDYDGWKQNYDAYELVEFLDVVDDSMLRTETVRIICDRGVTHELVRHRKCSFAQKSTRYCDEKGDIEFIEPCWLTEEEKGFNLFEFSVGNIEADYKALREKNWKPEQARNILPNALATEIVVKATIQEWKHIFELRAAKDAHPSMREIMIPLEEEFKKRGLIL